MPIVNGKEYAYTEEGIAAAEKAKKRSGFKMKYTNGKKTDVSAFPFANQVGNTVSSMSSKSKDAAGGVKDMIAEKIDEKVEEKVNKVVNQDTNEGLV